SYLWDSAIKIKCTVLTCYAGCLYVCSDPAWPVTLARFCAFELDVGQHQHLLPPPDLQLIPRTAVQQSALSVGSLWTIFTSSLLLASSPAAQLAMAHPPPPLPSAWTALLVVFLSAIFLAYGTHPIAGITSKKKAPPPPVEAPPPEYFYYYPPVEEELPSPFVSARSPPPSSPCSITSNPQCTRSVEMGDVVPDTRTPAPPQPSRNSRVMSPLPPSPEPTVLMLPPPALPPPPEPLQRLLPPAPSHPPSNPSPAVPSSPSPSPSLLPVSPASPAVSEIVPSLESSPLLWSLPPQSPLQPLSPSLSPPSGLLQPPAPETLQQPPKLLQ
ncbi:hypothetical protein Vretifemale_11443, partial [Volvox reticuliferus]